MLDLTVRCSDRARSISQSAPRPSPYPSAYSGRQLWSKPPRPASAVPLKGKRKKRSSAMSRFRLGSSTSLSAYENDEESFGFIPGGASSSSATGLVRGRGRGRGRDRRPKSSPGGSQLSPQPSVVSPMSSSPSLVSTMRQEWRSPHKEMWKRRDHNARHIAGRKQRPQTAPMGRRAYGSTGRKGPKAHSRMRQLQRSASSGSSLGFQTPQPSKRTSGKKKRPSTAGSALLAKQSVQRIKRSKPRPRTAAQSKFCFERLSRESVSRFLALSPSRTLALSHNLALSQSRTLALSPTRTLSRPNQPSSENPNSTRMTQGNG